MRRSDREITDISAIEDFIRSEKIMRVAFYDSGDIYIVPVNYGFQRTGSGYALYFHGAEAGRKYELAKTSPKVGFEIDGRFRLLESETACGFSAEFQSVIGTGRLFLIEDTDEKKAALDCIMGHQTGRIEWSYTDGMLGKTALFCITVEKMSCKAK